MKKQVRYATEEVGQEEGEDEEEQLLMIPTRKADTRELKRDWSWRRLFGKEVLDSWTL